ncbi:MAG: hypothetical protein MRK01_15665 [Candidatus Scalindua sp.]|nr:hypothetical protein [Candidatus Scalindua sp.]
MARPRKNTAIDSAEVKQVMQNLNSLSDNPSPSNTINLICSIMAADLKNQIPSDIVNRAYKFISLIYKKFDAETSTGIGLTGLFRGDIPRSLDMSSNELEGEVLEYSSVNQAEDNNRNNNLPIKLKPSLY